MRFTKLAAVLVVLSPCCAFAQDNQLAPEGRGLLPGPTAVPETLGGVPPPHPFEMTPSGVLARTVFETNEDPNFKLTIRDYSFPPDNQPRTLTLPAAALVQNRSTFGDVSIANQKVDLTGTARIAAPPGAPIGVTNNGDKAVVVRTITLEPK
jgi:hypothetical protein